MTDSDSSLVLSFRLCILSSTDLVHGQYPNLKMAVIFKMLAAENDKIMKNRILHNSDFTCYSLIIFAFGYMI